MIPFRSVSIDLTIRSDEKPGRQQKGGDDLSWLPVVLPAIAIENHLLVSIGEASSVSSRCQYEP
jgi:hypothetical protein